MHFSLSFLLNFTGAFVILIATILFLYKLNFAYWLRKNIPYLEPKIPFGNLENPLKQTETLGIQAKRMYDNMKRSKWKHGGVFFLGKPVYMVIDLEYVKNVLTKDFQYFVDRGFYYNEKEDPISAHLFAIGGTKWRNLRMKVTPTFTSQKIKIMFHLLMDCANDLQEKMINVCRRDQPINIKELLVAFTTNVIGSCAFGLDCNDSKFTMYGKKCFVLNSFERMKTFFCMNFPSAARIMGLRLISKEVSDFFTKVVKDTVEYREKNHYSRKDFIQLLIDLKNNKLLEKVGDGKSLTIDELVAQCFVLFIAGFETSSTTMTFALYELAKNHKIQEKLNKEINEVLIRHGGKITYEAIQEMKYMDQVINETLRKYPPVPFITRMCVKDYTIPDHGAVIEKGTRVVIPILGIHRDEEYYPDPEIFNPERFNEENVKSRHHYAHIPFGEGPRICLGLRFGIIESKIGLTSLLSKYKFSVNAKTREPLKFEIRSFVLAAEGDIWLDAKQLF